MSESDQQHASQHQDISKENNQKLKSLEFTLTNDQYTIIQHYLPKGFALLEKRGSGGFTKRERGSSYRFADAENISKISGGIDNQSENDGRSKRNRIKKIDRYLEDEMPRPTKRSHSEKHKKQDNVNIFVKVLHSLKRSSNSYPFLEPVDPKISGASNYFEIIKQPMDLSTVESNYNSGVYETLDEFNADIKKIWKNSYLYNEMNSKIYKMTVEMQKLHNKLINGVSGSTKYTGISSSKQKNYKSSYPKKQNSQVDGEENSIQPNFE